MRETHLTGAWPPAATNESGGGDGVMRRAERTCGCGAGGHQLRAQQSGHGVNSEYFECLLFIEWRQNAGQSTGKHGFAGARWADQQQVVRTGRRDFEGAHGE